LRAGLSWLGGKFQFWVGTQGVVKMGIPF